MDNIKLVGFDLDGTLIKGNSWVDLNIALGVTKEEDQAMYDAHVAGNLSYEDWLEKLADIYRAHGLATKDKIMEILSQVVIREGAAEAIAYLKSKGYKTAIISGSNDLIVDLVKEKLGIEYGFSVNTFVFDEANNFKAVKTLGLDTNAKTDLLNKLATDLGLNLASCAYIGDGYNDLGIFKATGHGIALAHAPIVDRAWKVIEGFDQISTVL